MSKYGIDLDKVEIKFNEVLATNDDKVIADFAREVIPLLLRDSSKVRLELVENLLNGNVVCRRKHTLSKFR